MLKIRRRVVYFAEMNVRMILRWLAIEVFVLTALGCAQRMKVPNLRMSAPPGPLELSYRAAHPGEEVIDPAMLRCEITPDAADVTEISLERTGCYGVCSMYTVVLRSDGTAEYHGYGMLSDLEILLAQLIHPYFEVSPSSQLRLATSRISRHTITAESRISPRLSPR
jgi:hypothetical protein